MNEENLNLEDSNSESLEANMLETQTVNETEKSEIEVQELELKEVPEYDYFAGVNRILTSSLAGIIGAGIMFGLVYFMAQIMQANLSQQDGLSIPFILVIIASVFVANFLAQTVQLYLYKLVEKEKYTELGNKVFVNLIAQLVLLVFALPFIFINFTKSGSSLLAMFVIYQVFSLGLSAGVREKGKNDRLIGNELGLFLAAALLISFADNLAVNPLVGVVILPLSLVLESLMDFLADLVVFWINKD
jgi:ABC-type multidrug transport system fused ATPase/permease subunit